MFEGKDKSEEENLRFTALVPHLDSIRVDVRSKRRFLDVNFDPTNPLAVKVLLDWLVDNPPKNLDDAQKWYGVFMESSAAFSEAHSLLELNQSLNFVELNWKEKIVFFEEQIYSQLLTYRDAIMEIYMNSPWRSGMHADDNDLIVREFIFKKRFSKNNSATLRLEESKLIREYRKFFSETKTQFFGKPTSLGIVVGKMSDTNLRIRKDAFFAYWSQIATKEAFLQENFTSLLDVRTQLFQSSGAPSYADFVFAELSRLDFNRNDCKIFRESILQSVVPAVEELSAVQISSLGANTLKPWDIGIWPTLIPKIPSQSWTYPKFLDAIEAICHELNPQIGESVKLLRQRNLIDIEPRSEKVSGAFCVAFLESRLPFVFGNFSFTFKDSMTLMHELGHALHVLFSSHIDNVLLRQPGLEFCEVASIGLEVLSSHHFEKLMDTKEGAEKARTLQLINFLSFWPFMAMIDEFQYKVYDNNIRCSKERNIAWANLSRTYRSKVDWSDCPEFEGLGWFSRQHIFTSPFYFVEYGIAQLCALQIWKNSFENRDAAVHAYIRALSLGAQRSLPQLFDVAGAKLNFGNDFLSSIVNTMMASIRSSLENFKIAE